jgi:hypothetical protein
VSSVQSNDIIQRFGNNCIEVRCQVVSCRRWPPIDRSAAVPESARSLNDK